MTPRFAKVRVNGVERLIRITTESRQRISGWRVDKSGEKWGRRIGKFDQEEFVVTTPACVVERLRLNLHYGELEPARCEQSA